MKTIKIKCLKYPKLKVIEMVYFEGIERVLIELWELNGQTENYQIMEEEE
jgi:hypothetical protein